MTARSPRRRLQIAILAGLLLLLTGAAAASAASAGATLFHGTGHRAQAADPAGVSLGGRALSLSLRRLTPGETTRARQVVANDEARTVRYALTSTSSNDDRKGVRDVLTITIRTADLGSGPSGTCDAFDGRVLYDGLLGAAGAGFGDPTMGDQAGDRLIEPGERETLCFEMRMRLDAGNEHQAATTATTWTIEAEQTSGNP